MMNQQEVLTLVRENPNSTIAELVEVSCPKDRHERVTRKNNFSNKLHHLKRFGLVDSAPVERGVERRWYAVEMDDTEVRG